MGGTGTNGHELKMQRDTGSSITILSTEMWAELGSPRLLSHAQCTEAYDGNLRRQEESLDCEII